MSVTVDNPYEKRTSLAIDVANRLLSLRGHPGFQDLMRLSQETVRLAEVAVTEYEGWDKDELVARSIAFRAAKRSHEMLFVRMANAIQAGISEATTEQGNTKEAADMADELRALVVKQLDEENVETRVSGTY